MSAAIQLGVAPGRADDDRTRIARAVILMLESLTRRQGRYLEALDHYRGELSSGDLEQAMTKLRGRAPALLVTVGSSNPESKSTSRLRYLYLYQIEIAVISTHMDSPESREVGGADRFEPNADPGIGKMLHDVRRLLAGRSPNVEGCNHLIPEGESIIADGDLAIYATRFSVGMAFTQSKNPDPLPTKAESAEVTTTASVEQTQ